MPEPQSHSTGSHSGVVDRRRFVATTAAAAAAAWSAPTLSWADSHHPGRPTVCAFIKFLQALSYDDMAAVVADIGFDGVESTVRRKGHVLPERVKEDLPRQNEALKKRGLDMTIMTTDILSIDDPHAEDVLRTGASIGAKLYRMGFYKYDLDRDILPQLDEIRSKVRDLAAINRELGLTAVYQNHCGKDYVGAPIWDLRYVLEGVDPSEVGVAFDIRHATIEGGQSWPIEYRLMKPHLGAVYAKDFRWDDKKPQHVPLGEGRVDRKFFKEHLASGIEVPLSLHVEYLKKGSVEENIAALRRDFTTLSEWIA